MNRNNISLLIKQIGLLIALMMMHAAPANAGGPYASAFLRGSFNSWGKTAMVDTSGGVVWDISNVRFCGAAVQEFKIDVSGNWTTAFGSNDKYLLGESDSTFVSTGTTKNLRLTTNGIYNIRFAATSTYAYVETHKSGDCTDPPLPSAFLRGTFNGNGKLAMVNDGSGQLWTAQGVRFCSISSYDFKVDVYGNGNVGFGAMSASEPPLDPANGFSQAYLAYNLANSIRLSGPGVYTIQFNTASPSSPPSVFATKSSECDTTPSVHLRGTFNAWGLLAMTPVAGSPNEYFAEPTFGATSAERFKFDLSTNWTQAYGENNNPPDFISDLGGADIKITQGAGKYKITFNRSTKGYKIQKLDAPATCQKSTMFLMSSARNFAAHPDTGEVNKGSGLPMACVGGEWQATETFAGTGSVFQAGAYKFATDANYSEEWGAGSTPGKAVLKGKNITIPEDQQGIYVVKFNDKTLDFSATRQFSLCGNSMYVRGGFNGWGTQKMHCVGQNLLAAIVMFNTAGEFKFDTFGDWKTNYGDKKPADFTADLGAADNIAVSKAGRYLVTFDVNTRKYSLRHVSRACKYQKMSLLKSGVSMPMECENGHWALEPDFNSTGSVKFDSFRGVEKQFGDNTARMPSENMHFPAVEGGAAIPLTVTGHYHIHFYDRDDSGPSEFELPNHYRLCRGGALGGCHQ